MTDLFLVFVCAAFLENLLISRIFDSIGQASDRGDAAVLWAAAMLLFAVIAAHLFPQVSAKMSAQALVYLNALTFIAVAMAAALEVNVRAVSGLRPRLQLLHKYLPLLVASLSVLTFAILDQRHRHGLRDAVIFCLGASLAFRATTVLLRAVRERLAGLGAPASLQGNLILAVTVCLIALAMMGFGGALPW